MSSDSPRTKAVDASSLRFAIAAASFNGRLVDALLLRVTARLAAAGVKPGNLTVLRVPGSNELPVAAALLLDSGKPDAIIALGVIVRGGTIHYELIANAAAAGLVHLAVASRTPIINGVVVAENAAQARARCSGRLDRGTEFADAALTMAAIRRSLSR